MFYCHLYFCKENSYDVDEKVIKKVLLERNEGAVTESYGPLKKNFTIKVVIPEKVSICEYQVFAFFISPSLNIGRVLKCVMAAFMKTVFGVLNTKSHFVL